MKNKGLIGFLIIICFFILLDFLIVDKFNKVEDENNRIFLVSNIENLQIVKNSNLKISGDYLVGFNLDKNQYEAIYIDGNLSLVNDKEYSNAKYYKQKDYNLYISLLESNFNIKIDEYFKINSNDIKTNITKSAKDIYKRSLSNINNMKLVLDGNLKMYLPSDNYKWLRLLNYYNIGTNKTINKKILKDSIEQIKEIPNYKQGFYLSFFDVYYPKLDCKDFVCTYQNNDINEVEKTFKNNVVADIDYKKLDFTKLKYIK